MKYTWRIQNKYYYDKQKVFHTSTTYIKIRTNKDQQVTWKGTCLSLYHRQIRINKYIILACMVLLKYKHETGWEIVTRRFMT